MTQASESVRPEGRTPLHQRLVFDAAGSVRSNVPASKKTPTKFQESSNFLSDTVVVTEALLK